MADVERLVQIAANLGISGPSAPHFPVLRPGQAEMLLAKRSGLEAWDYLKRRLAELGLLDRFNRTKANCLRR